MTDVYEATCWDGPLHGQRIASPRPDLVALVAPARYYDPAEPLSPIAPAIQERRYTFARIAVGPLEFGAWVISGPSERREAVMDTILGGLHTVWVLTQLAAR